MMRLLRAALAVLALGCASALAQSSFPSVGGGQVDGKVVMCWNGTNAVPCLATGGTLQVGGAGSGGPTSGFFQADEAAAIFGSSPFAPVGCFYFDTITALSNGHQGAFTCDTSRELNVTTLSTSNLAAILNAAPNVNVGTTPTAWQGKTAGGETGGSVDINSIVGTTALTGPGAAGAGALRITNAQDATTISGANPGRTYNTVAASQTAQVLSSTNGGSTGAAGDYLSHCVITPATTSPGAVQIFDNTNSGATVVYSFAGGASSVSTLISWAVPIGAVSTAGGWKVTTSTNVSVTCAGKFT